jgi:N-acetylmuramoyl-L-alanine amidase/putative methionine-R-sulfoxide reductase with GAF domain
MATIPTKREVVGTTPPTAASVPARPTAPGVPSSGSSGNSNHDHSNDSRQDEPEAKPSRLDALQALLAFSALHEQIRQRKALAARNDGFDAGASSPAFEKEEQFILDEVLRLVAERAIAITGADGLAIALAENNEIVMRAAAGTVRPDVGARIDRDSAFSGASFRHAQVINCDDTETDPRVNLEACHRLGARSMVAVPLCGRKRVIGLLEAFSSWPFAFNDSDVRNLTLLAELVVSALKPEDEDRFTHSAQAAITNLGPGPIPQSVPDPRPQIASTRPVFLPQALPTQPASTFAVPRASSRPQVASPGSAIPGSTKPVEVKAAEVKSPELQPAETRATGSKAAAVPPPPCKTDPAVLAGVTSIPLPPKATASALPEFESPTAAANSTYEPQLTFGQETERPSRRPAMLLVLICIVIVAAFAGGVWWKLKTAQLGGMVVKNSSQASNSGQGSGSLATVNSAAEPNADMPTEAADPLSPPASPQELAKFPRITGIRHWSSADSSTVVFDLEDQVQYETHRLTGPDRIYFDLHDTQLAPELAGKSVDVGDTLLGRIRAAQPVAGMTRVVLETRGNSNFSVSLEPNPYRLVVELRKIGAATKSAVNLFPDTEAERNRLAIVVPPPTKEDLLLRARIPKMRIVVDAGHGGWDLGTVGRRGLLEKDLVLEIAERLGKLLESRLGMEVVYTRLDDNYIPLDERAEIANQSQADLFVSVHANYSDLLSARGVETYYTNTYSAPGSKEAVKDADPHSTVKNSVTPTLSPADLREKVDQSRRLAASVQRSLYGALAVQNPGLRDRGIKEAGFVVLTESAMPGILAEVSFVSSPTDEQKLRSDGYREQIAEALYKGIARYAASSKAVKVASAAK